jgi:hypothetical protein
VDRDGQTFGGCAFEWSTRVVLNDASVHKAATMDDFIVRALNRIGS